MLHLPQAQSQEFFGPSILCQENEWPCPGRQAGRKGSRTLDSWKATGVCGEVELAFASAPEENISSLS